METKLIITSDGSHSLYVPDINECYHSIHGAVNESNHVYIKEGLMRLNKNPVCIFELGFGTGLNAYLTYTKAKELNLRIIYHTIDTYRLPDTLIRKLNYPETSKINDRPLFLRIHKSKWNEKVVLSPSFSLMKIHADIREYSMPFQYDLIYFDAFAPDKQPELWELPVLKKMFEALNPGGILVTYSAKGDFRRLLTKIGYQVEKRPGPGLKRHMTLAIKSDTGLSKSK